MLDRVQVRGRLLLSFFAIAGLAVLAAAAAIYSFLEVGGVLNRITGERVPSALASQELSRQAERIVAIAPALLAVGDSEQHQQISTEIAAEVARLDELLADVERSSRDASVLETITLHVGMMERNLDALDALVADRLAAVARKTRLLRRLSDVDIATQRLLTPGTLAMEGEILELQRISRDESLSADQRARAMSKLVESIAAVPRLQRARAQAAAANTSLLLAASAETAADLVVLTVPLARSMAAIESAAGDLSPSLGERLTARAEEFRSLASGEESIPKVRQHELVTVEVIEILLAKNREFSGVLTAALDDLVAGANRDIGDANREALSIQRFSTVIMAAVAALVVVSSFLIVWLYVGRNLIARLTKLTDSMMAIAGGQLEAPIPSGGSDEISRMGDALTVFRGTAIAAREAERALREAKQDLETRVADRTKELRIALDHMPGGMLLVDADLKVLFVSDQYIELLALPAELVAPGKSTVDMARFQVERGDFREVGLDQEIERTKEVFRSGGTLRYEAHLQGGGIIEVQMASAPGGGGVAVARDISEQKKAQRQLRKSEQTFKAVVDQIPLALALNDGEGRYTLVNPTFRGWFAEEGQDVVGLTAFDVFPEEVAAEITEVDRRIKETGEPVTQEIVEPFADGSRHTALMSKFPIRDHDGTVVAIGSVESDITELREQAELVSESERRLRHILESSPIAICISIDDGSPEDGVIKFANPRFKELIGIDESDLGKARTEQFVPHSDVREDFEAHLDAGETLRNIEIQIIGEGGRKTWSLLSISPIRFDDRQSALIWLYDISELKGVEDELRVARDAAEVATEAKSVFLASMSHELRTPLNAIIGYSEMLMEDAEGSGREDTVPDLRRIRSAGNHLLKLIRDVLDLSKIEAGKAEVFAEDFEVATLIEDVRAVIEPLMANNSNRFVVEHDVSLGSMRSDTTKIRQNLFNLLSNAAKFTENGEVRLRVTGVEYGGAEALRFVVSDTGIGIEPDKIEALFDEFTQADASTTKRYGGAGLARPDPEVRRDAGR